MATRIEILSGDPTYLFWAGDGPKNDANAIFYIKNDGTSYFGGILSVGFLRVQVSNSQAVANPTVETGEFETNGRPKQVSVTFSYHNGASGNSGQGNPPPSLPPTVSGTITLERRVNGGAWSTVPGGTATITGTASLDMEGVEWFANVSASGSLVITDSDSRTPTFEYRAKVTNGKGFPHWLPGSMQGSGMGTQSLTLISTEY